MLGSKADWRIGKTSAESFRNISEEVLSLHVVLKESQENLLVPPPPPTREARLRVVLKGCTNVLNDLQALVKKYEGLGSKSKVTWDRMKWCKENVAEIRARLTSNVAMLTVLISNSQASVQVKLDKLVEDYQQGKRESTLHSDQTVDSLTTEDRVSWRTIRKELQEIGITVAAFEANRDFIMNWLTHAIKTGAFQEQNASGSESQSVPQSPSTSSGSITEMTSNTPAIYASSEVYHSTEHHSPTSSSDRPIPSSPNTQTLADMAISWPVVADESSTNLKVPSHTLSKIAEPYIACERCGKSNIAYELHMHCEHCKDGNYDVCLQCWRRGRGCLNWYGFGNKSVTNYHRIVDLKARKSSGSDFPHALTGRRYHRVTARQPSTDLRDENLLTQMSDLKVELQYGFFCSNCSAFAHDDFWLCDICNDGDWGYCSFCVRGGRCCTHPLLHVGSHPSTSDRSIDCIDSLPSVKTSRSPLACSIYCSICALPILPPGKYFHCPRCDEGDYDVCVDCYLKLVDYGHISEADGPRGWRRYLKGHRMIIFGFRISARGQEFVVVEDVVGGHALKVLNPTPASGGTAGGGSLRVLALWSYWPEEGDDDELAFPKGAEIQECEKINGDWFWGIYCGRKGLFPGNYCQAIVERVDESSERPDGCGF